MSKELIEKLETAREKTTPGEWRAFINVVYKGTITLAECPISHTKSLDQPVQANAEFIALAHNSLPELLEYVKGLEEALESYIYSFYRANYQPDRPLFNGVPPTNEALDKAWELLGITKDNFSERQRAYRDALFPGETTEEGNEQRND